MSSKNSQFNQHDVVVVSDFVKSHISNNLKNENFSDFLKYQERDSANFSGNDNSESYLLPVSISGQLNYQDRLDRNKREVESNYSMAFNQKHSTLSKNEYEKLKQDFDKADKSGNTMFREIISFDTDFLIKNNIATKKDDDKTIKSFKEDMIVDQGKLRNIIVEWMNNSNGFLVQNGFSDNAIWSANIHQNTNDLHVHIAITELGKSSRPTMPNGEIKGKLSQQVIKRQIKKLHDLITNSDKFKTLNQKIGVMTDDLKSDFIKIIEQKKSDYLFKKVWEVLPENKNLWRVNGNNKSIEEAKDYAFLLVDEFIGDNKVANNLFEQIKLRANEYGENDSESEIKANKAKDEFRKDLVQRLFTEFKKLNDSDFKSDEKTLLKTKPDSVLEQELKYLSELKRTDNISPTQLKLYKSNQSELRRRNNSYHKQKASENSESLLALQNSDSKFNDLELVKQLIKDQIDREKFFDISLKPTTFRTDNQKEFFYSQQSRFFNIQKTDVNRLNDNNLNSFIENTNNYLKLLNQYLISDFKDEKLDIVIENIFNSDLKDVSNKLSRDIKIAKLKNSVYNNNQEIKNLLNNPDQDELVLERIKKLKNYNRDNFLEIESIIENKPIKNNVSILVISNKGVYKPVKAIGKYKPTKQVFKTPNAYAIKKIEDGLNVNKPRVIKSILEQSFLGELENS